MAEMDSTAVHVACKGSEITAAAVYKLMQSLSQKAFSPSEKTTSKVKSQFNNYESVQINDRSIKDIKSDLNRYSIDFHIIKDKKTGQSSVLLKGKNIQHIYDGLTKYMADHKQSTKTTERRSLRDLMRDAVRSANIHNQSAQDIHTSRNIKRDDVTR